MPQGETAINKFELIQDIIIVENGSLEVLFDVQDFQLRLATLHQGDIMNHQAIFIDDLMRLIVKASTTCHLLKINLAEI